MTTKRQSSRKGFHRHAAREPLAFEQQRADQLLRDAVEIPGKISDAFHLFHNFSIGNSLFLMEQMEIRGIAVGPVGTYPFWEAHGRHVISGPGSALWVVVPYDYTRVEVDEVTGEEVAYHGKVFKPKPIEFALSQTAGEDYVPAPVGDWDPDRAVAALNITMVPFAMVDGNCQGYATPSERTVAILPIAEHPEKTLVHEMAHVLLHEDTDDMTRGDKEMEAECVALLVGDALGLAGAAESRGYVQNWYGAGHAIDEKNAQRIMHAASEILTAGWPAKVKETEATAAVAA